MADCITTRHPKGTFRRTSVTQGTISSMAKEVVKPYTSKSQRTQQQKNLNRVKSPKNLDHSQSLLRASIRDSQQQNETVQVKQTKKHSKKRRSGAKMTVPRSVPHSVDFRLDTASLGTMHLQQHNMTPTLSENDIVSCGLKEPWTIHQRDWIPPSPEEEEEEEDSGGSSSASSFSANFTSSKSNELSIAPLLSDCSKQVIIENLDSSFRTYSNQVKGILENPGTTDKPFIQECRSLIYQQNSLLNQLETFSDKKKVISTVSSSQTSLKEDILVTSLENTWSNFTQLFQTSGVTIHKKVNDPNSIVAVVKGTGTTLLTEYMKKNNSENNANPCPVDSSYELNITSQAKEAVFIFTDDWKPDSSVKQCEFLDGNGTQCDTLFSFFARKHHCRRCGHIYCGAHSSNKLPLFKDDEPITSRVCDSCFTLLVTEHIVE